MAHVTILDRHLSYYSYALAFDIISIACKAARRSKSWEGYSPLPEQESVNIGEAIVLQLATVGGAIAPKPPPPPVPAAMA